ncbi:MAG TPA: xanthine dehydrogenase small subunit, partial [Opitutaceae bacterium]|nr:xanthine dehydrogenase small subunit [Opitutaceae bacterium]
MGFGFTLNGRAIRVDDAAPTTTLLEYLRASGLTGSKQGCAEGDCGACTVAIVERDAAGNPAYRAINSCIALLPTFAGRGIVTVEGLEGDGGALHPVQSAMVDHYGSQCGYCTPGFVMSLFEGYYRRDCRAARDISDQLCGNLCRCTGYRPIRDAALACLGERDAARRRAKDCPADPFRERLKSPVPPPPSLDYEAGGERFVRPTSLADLFAALAGHPQARLVAGATEIGVDVAKRARSFPLLVSTESVPELAMVSKTASAWRIGAGATLTAVGEALGGEFPSLTKMFNAFASRQIRNRATLGGNLATASPIGDGAPVLLSLDAELVLASETGRRTVPLSEFFTAYRKTLLEPGEIILEIVIPRFDPACGLTRRSDFLKVSKRRELDISIVAAAFSIDTDAAGIIRRARLAYGGVAATPVRARPAESALEGRRLGEAAAEAALILAGEFKPIDDVRGGAAYRRGLIVSLWEKFASGDTSAAQDGPLDFERGLDAIPADASRALRHESAVGHVTGRALYADDTAQRRPMLDIWPVCSPHARARILRRDAAKARAMPGVVAVLMSEDIPGLNNVGTGHDEPLFAGEEVRYHGQVVAIVVGRSLRACRAAAFAVEVDYEPRPAILGIKEAIRESSFHTPPHTIVRGDWKGALARSPLKLEGEFSFGGQEHFYLETQAAWAEAGEGGTVFVSSSTQHPTEIQAVVAEVLGQPRNKVVVQSPRMGGGFGGKETQGNAFAAMVALASVRTRQPVRIQLDRDLDMTITGKRHPFLAKFSVGYDRKGAILAAAVDLYSDGGWSLDLSQPVLDRALFHVDNGYYIPALRATGLIAETNVASNTAFRGF